METQNLAKWISELQAQIDQVKRMAIAAAASGGDSVTITPALDSGTKIADYTIGEETSGSLYAPDGIAITPALDSGTKIADYTIGEASGSLYAPEGGGIEYSATPVKIGKSGNDDVYRVRVKASGLTVQSWTNVVSDTSSWDVKDVLNMNVMYIDKHNSPYVYIFPNYIQNVEVRWDTTAATPKIQAHFLTTGSYTGDIVVVIDFTKNTAAKSGRKSKKSE